ncbi:MAG: hypothetical protein VW715_01195, partial [Rhodospirillales bacterium]
MQTGYEDLVPKTKEEVGTYEDLVPLEQTNNDAYDDLIPLEQPNAENYNDLVPTTDAPPDFNSMSMEEKVQQYGAWKSAPPPSKWNEFKYWFRTKFTP